MSDEPGLAYREWLARNPGAARLCEEAFRAGWKARFEPDDDGLIGVRAAADMLGVHENTVRNWAASGWLAIAAVTPAGYKRFDPAEVRRVSSRMDAIGSEFRE